MAKQKALVLEPSKSSPKELNELLEKGWTVKTENVHSCRDAWLVFLDPPKEASDDTSGAPAMTTYKSAVGEF